jgi:hypothetical protein
MKQSKIVCMDNWVALIFQLYLEGKLNEIETELILEEFDDVMLM